MLRNMQLVRSVGISAALALTVFMAGCGGGGDASNEAAKALYQFGQADFKDITANRGVAPSNNTLSGAASVATDGSKFYIADTNNNRVLGFNSIPTSATATADFVIGQANFTANDPCIGACPTGLNQPSKVIIDAGRLLVVDSGNDRVLVWSTLPTSNVTSTFKIGNGIGQPAAADTLSGPLGATFAGTKLVVADTGNNRVLIYNTIANNAPANIVLGQRNFTSGQLTPNCPKDTVAIPDCTLDFAITADSISGPSDVWSNGSKLVVSDQANNRVLYFNQVPAANQTAAARVIGQSNMKNQGGFGSGPSALKQPRGVWLDKNTSYIYIADAGNNRVLAFNTPTADGSSAIAVYGQGDYNHVTANDDDQDNSPDLLNNGNGKQEASDRTLSNPLGMATFATAGTNRIYIVDANNARLMVYDTN
ncbi:MAG: NHL repeat-containing protein [Pseudomonadota bacterium]